VLNGVNGHLFPLDAGPKDYADYALELLGEPDRYSKMCWQSFERFRTDLNWDVAATRLMAEMSEVVQPVGGSYAYSPSS
jgi:hypothetical protein